MSAVRDPNLRFISGRRGGGGKRSRGGRAAVSESRSNICLAQRAWWNSRAASPTSGARLRWYLRRRSARYYHVPPPATPRLVNGNFHRNFATARENLLAVRATVREAARSPTDSTDPTLFQSVPLLRATVIFSLASNKRARLSRNMIRVVL